MGTVGHQPSSSQVLSLKGIGRRMLQGWVTCLLILALVAITKGSNDDDTNNIAKAEPSTLIEKGVNLNIRNVREAKRDRLKNEYKKDKIDKISKGNKPQKGKNKKNKVKQRKRQNKKPKKANQNEQKKRKPRRKKKGKVSKGNGQTRPKLENK